MGGPFEKRPTWSSQSWINRHTVDNFRLHDCRYIDSWPISFHLHWGERIVGVEASISDGVIRVRNSLTVRTASSATRASDTSSDPDAESTGEATVCSPDCQLSWPPPACRRAQAVCRVGRRQNVVTRWLELPAVPDEELPELVRWQAGTKSTLSVDQLIVDYLPLPDGRGCRDASGSAGDGGKIDTVVGDRAGNFPQRELDLRGVGVGSLALTELALENAPMVTSPTDGRGGRRRPRINSRSPFTGAGTLGPDPLGLAHGRVGSGAGGRPGDQPGTVCRQQLGNRSETRLGRPDRSSLG